MAAYVPGIETLGLPKLAVIALLARLLMPNRIHLWILWCMGIICCLSLTAMVTTLLLQCSPPRALWTLTMPRDCLDPSTLEGLAFWASCWYTLSHYYPRNLTFLSGFSVSRLLSCCVPGDHTLEASHASQEKASIESCPWNGYYVSGSALQD